MTKKRIKWTVKVINQRIEHYQRKLSGQLKLQVESMFHNGLFDCSDIGDIESNIKKYEIIIADLETIKSAIKRGRSFVRIYSFDEATGDIASDEMYDTLVNRAKLHVEGLDGELYFIAEEYC